MYSPETNKFIIMATMKIARESFACCRVGNLVYVIGERTKDYKNISSVEIYSLDSNTWCYGTDIPFVEPDLYACAE